MAERLEERRNQSKLAAHHRRDPGGIAEAALDGRHLPAAKIHAARQLIR
jgi:hypothetical protein